MIKQIKRRRLSDAWKLGRRLSDTYPHHFKKKIYLSIFFFIFLIFGTVKRINPRAVGKTIGFWIEMY